MKKGFTLIELLAVLTILAIIALIATPIVLNIIKDTSVSAAKRSIENYVHAVELGITKKNMEGIEYNPSLCTISRDNTRSTVCGGEVLDIDLEGDYPTSGTLIIQNGKVTSVRDIGIKDYYFSSDAAGNLNLTNNAFMAYKVGDQFTYDGIDWFVIANSDANNSTVTVMNKITLGTEAYNTYIDSGTYMGEADPVIYSNTSLYDSLNNVASGNTNKFNMNLTKYEYLSSNDTTGADLTQVGSYNLIEKNNKAAKVRFITMNELINNFECTYTGSSVISNCDDTTFSNLLMGGSIDYPITNQASNQAAAGYNWIMYKNSTSLGPYISPNKVLDIRVVVTIYKKNI